MKDENLEGKEYVTIGGKKYFLVSIPAIKAEEMFFELLPVLKSLDVTKLPFSFVMSLMPYCGFVNEETNSEIRFTSPEIIGMYVTNPVVLMELQARVLGKNFGFFSDGSLMSVTAVLSNAFRTNTQEKGSVINQQANGAQQ